jgi:hypothetical protein
MLRVPSIAVPLSKTHDRRLVSRVMRSMLKKPPLSLHAPDLKISSPLVFSCQHQSPRNRDRAEDRLGVRGWALCRYQRCSRDKLVHRLFPHCWDRAAPLHLWRAGQSRQRSNLSKFSGTGDGDYSALRGWAFPCAFEKLSFPRRSRARRRARWVNEKYLRTRRPSALGSALPHFRQAIY